MSLNSPLLVELAEFFRFFYIYCKTRLFNVGHHFESAKDIIVAILVVKRGKYSQSFLNTTFFILVSAVIVGGPVIAENNPLIAEYFTQDEQPIESSVLATDIYSLPVDTNISQRPREQVVTYVVEGGDTLDSISKKFDVSTDSIKWASNLKTEKIKPGDKLQIPPVTGIVHKVASGESIYSIAKKYHVDAQNIVNYQLNDFADLDTFALTPGQALVVPDGILPQERINIPRRTQTIAAGQPGTGNFIWPTSGNISQSPVWYHMALDIANRSLPPVIAADTGTVSYAGCLKWGYGCHIILNHANGFETLYAHLSRIDVSVGQGIARGTTIGQVGSTGRSTGPHLHFEIRSGGRLLNPLSYLK